MLAAYDQTKITKKKRVTGTAFYGTSLPELKRRMDGRLDGWNKNETIR